MNSFNSLSSNICKKIISPAFNSSLYENTGLSVQAYTSYFDDNPNAFNARTIITKVRNLQTINTAFLGTGINTGGDYFSGQWTGYFKSDFTGNFTFNINSDDQTNFWIGENAINNYNNTTRNIFAAYNNPGSLTIKLEKDRYYPIRIQYGDYVGAQSFAFSFTRNGETKPDSTNYLYSVKSGVPNLRGNPAVFI
jgi:hypothetical protein